MKAGRELDALIAKKVTKVISCEWEHYNSYSVKKVCDHKDGECSASIFYPPYYSTSISDAWEVIRKIRNEWIFSKRVKFKDQLQLIISERVDLTGLLVNNKEIILLVEPVDICLAALKCVEGD